MADWKPVADMSKEMQGFIASWEQRLADARAAFEQTLHVVEVERDEARRDFTRLYRVSVDQLASVIAERNAARDSLTRCQEENTRLVVINRALLAREGSNGEAKNAAGRD